MTIPYSGFASPQSKVEFLKLEAQMRAGAAATDIAAQRQVQFQLWGPALQRVKTLYPVDRVAARLGGVPVEVVTPREGIAVQNKHRVLINLHGGGMVLGAHVFSVLESVPVASLGKIKVVAVDYRLGPEHRFPAASEDVVAVYQALLQDYPASNIGIYGCSSGGDLTAEAMAWILKQQLPHPGALGIFCGAAGGWLKQGDSAYLAGPLNGVAPAPITDLGPYFAGANLNDPMLQPVLAPKLLAQFPPTLILTSTRDSMLSPALDTHRQLVNAGVEAELHVWDGMVHAFFTVYPDIPETHDALRVITRFFEARLGTEPSSNNARAATLPSHR